MKSKRTALLLIFCLLLGGCATVAENESEPAEIVPTAAPLPIDIDMTALNTGMTYAYLCNITNAPEKYLGQRIAVRGVCGQNFWEETQTTYHFVTVPDTNGCCEAAIEYIAGSEALVYPEKGTTATITGVVAQYVEDGSVYCHIVADSIVP